MGPVSKDDGACVTCGKNYESCPGHPGHVELCIPVYNPLVFGELNRLLKGKCMNCHKYRAGGYKCRVAETKIRLVEKGKVKDALDLDDRLAVLQAKVVQGDEEGTPSKKSSSHSPDATRSVYNYLNTVMMSTLPLPPVTPTAHERSILRTIIHTFMSSNGGYSDRCGWCNAYSPRVRQVEGNKFFLGHLNPKQLKSNNQRNIEIESALPGGSSPNGGRSPEESESESDGDEGGGGGVKKQDRFMTALEVQSQAKKTWELEPFLSSRVFGSTHTSDPHSLEALKSGHTIFFQRALLVPPSRFRPPMVMGNMTVEHSQNGYVNKIIQLNAEIRQGIAAAAVKPPEPDSENFNEEVDAYTKLQGKTDEVLQKWIELQLQVNCYVDSSKDPQAGQGNTPPGIRQLLERKEGIFRKHMMGKRVNYACRSVISPDPYIGTNEIGIPVKFAKTLNFPESVTAFNVEKMRDLVIRGSSQYPGANWVEEADGRRYELKRMPIEKREALAARLLGTGVGGQMKVGRQLENGDTMLVNRQPTLHKPGIMAHHVRVLHSPSQQTIRMHYANCNTYNADFDGDEMNCHFPQNFLARSESENIVSNDLQYIVPTDGSPLRGLIQDHVDGGVKMCCKDSFMGKEEYYQLVYSAMATLPGLEVLSHDENIIFLPPAVLKPRKLWTGKQVVSTLLQNLRHSSYKDVKKSKGPLPGISMARKTKTPATAFGESMMEHQVLIRDGFLLRGVLDKAAFGATDMSLVHAVHEAYGPHKAGLLLNSLGRLFTAYIQYYAGHSCRMEDLVLKRDADRDRRALVQKAYNQGMRAAAAWADSEGGKSDIKDADLPTTPLKPHEHAAAAKKIHTLLTNPQGASNASALDSYMQGKLNPLASQVIKRCLPDGLAVPFPYNTFSLMCSTGAKGSIVNQSQVSCGLGQQALEGRRVPRMSSGRTLPSFKPYDPNPRADGFITDRFLTGIRPQEYYFHCMSGREGLVDTAVKTSRSGYLQRCLVKHLEELTVAYDNTVRDAEGNVIQFLYGEDGVDPTKAAHLDCKSSTLQYMARNAEALEARYVKVPKPSLAKALEDARDAAASSKSLSKGAVVQARKPRSESSYKKGCDLLDGFFEATVKKVHSDGSVDVAFKDDKSKVKGLPSSFVKRFVRDPILNDASRSKHRIGVSGSCVSERVAKAVSDALEKDDPELRAAMNSSGVDAEKMGSLVARKYADALIAPGEAVGSIAAQSVGEPSTQMTLNTFHLAGHGGANVTLGIPRVREIIMTASRALKTPLMSVPFVPNMKEPQMNKAARSFTKLRLQELLHHEGGVTVHESIKQGMGEWKRAYEVVLHLQPEERIKEAFGLSYDKIAERVGDVFLSRLGALMKAELSRARLHDGETGETGIDIPVGGSRTLKKMAKPKKGDDGDEENNDLSAEERKMAADAKKKKDKKRQKDSEEYDNEEADEEDGVMGSRFGHRAEMATYEDDSSDEEEGAKSSNSDELEPEYEEAMVAGVTINRRNGSLILDSIEVDVSTRPLLMVDLALKATENVIIKSRPAIETGMVVEQEGRGKCLQTEGVNFEELWQLGDDVVDHCRIKSNDIWGIRCAYGVEAARQSIVNEIRGVFGVYGIDVDARHLMLIADYMTHDGDYKPMNRRGMMDGSSAFLKMSFETTATFMTEAAMKGEVETLKSPSANIVLGNPVKAGTGAMDLIVKV